MIHRFVVLLLIFLISTATGRVTEPQPPCDPTVCVLPECFCPEVETTHWTPELYPDPSEPNFTCGHNQKFNFICDPDLLLNKDQARVLDTKLGNYLDNSDCVCDSCKNRGRGIVIGIALVKDFNLGTCYQCTEAQTIDNFAHQIRKSWNLSECQNDLIILIASNRQMISVSMGEKTAKLLSTWHGKQFFENAKNHFELLQHFESLSDIIEAIQLHVLQTKLTARIESPVEGFIKKNALENYGISEHNTLNELASLDWRQASRNLRHAEPFHLTKKENGVEKKNSNSDDSLILARKESNELNDLITRVQRDMAIVPPPEESSKLTLGAIVAISCSCLLAILIITGALMFWYCRTRTGRADPEVTYTAASKTDTITKKSYSQVSQAE